MKKHLKLSTALAAALLVLFSAGSFAYALDAGGIRTTIMTWLNGSSQQVTYTETEPGNFTYDYEENGETIHAGGGGISLNEDGSQSPLTAQEFADTLGTDLLFQEDGTILYYDHDFSVDVSDLFQDGICKITYINWKNTRVYVTIELEEGQNYSISSKTSVSSPGQYIDLDD